uniref:Endonuclease/exonuclease/phosphatase domain-containing protein n=1 Tax=Parascaris univalens TaxID=6257 RepID=A0A915AGX7_PARUN
MSALNRFFKLANRPLVSAFALNCGVHSTSVERAEQSITRNRTAEMSRGNDMLTRSSMKLPDSTIFIWHDAPLKSKRVDNDGSELSTSVGRVPLDISILLTYEQAEEPSSYVIAMRRRSDDKYVNTLQRLRVKLSYGSKKKRKGAVVGDADLVPLEVMGVDNSKLHLWTNEDVFYNSEVSSLQIGTKPYRLVRDAADCSSLAIALKPIVGCPLMASYDMRSGPEISSEPTFHWYVGPQSLSAVQPTEVNDTDGSRSFVLNGWEWRHKGRTFMPEERDIGRRVCVLIDLGPDTIRRCAISAELISDRPGEPYLFERRQNDYCTDWQKDGFRVMSYNILAALYLNLEQGQEDLFFPYCPKEYQEYIYRYPVLMREIPGYKADLVFLQEVDDRFQMRYLPALMREHGYEVCFKRKAVAVNEGLMICFRTEHFKLMEIYDMWLTDLLDLEKFPENEDVVRLLERDEETRTLFTTRPTVIQLISLETQSASGEKATVLAANTHLYFDPRHEHIKTLQSVLCARYIARISDKLCDQQPRARLYRLFAGDFNSTPSGGVYELLSQGVISEQHECWKSGATIGRVRLGTAFKKGGENITFWSLANDPEVTNYTRFTREDGTEGGFEGCLDYLWGSENIRVNFVIPMPSDKLVLKYTALPSKIAPSDHMPIICNVVFD